MRNASRLSSIRHAWGHIRKFYFYNQFVILLSHVILLNKKRLQPFLNDWKFPPKDPKSRGPNPSRWWEKKPNFSSSEPGPSFSNCRCRKPSSPSSTPLVNKRDMNRSQWKVVIRYICNASSYLLPVVAYSLYIIQIALVEIVQYPVVCRNLLFDNQVNIPSRPMSRLSPIVRFLLDQIKGIKITNKSCFIER